LDYEIIDFKKDKYNRLEITDFKVQRETMVVKERKKIRFA